MRDRKSSKKFPDVFGDCPITKNGRNMVLLKIGRKHPTGHNDTSYVVIGAKMKKKKCWLNRVCRINSGWCTLQHTVESVFFVTGFFVSPAYSSLFQSPRRFPIFPMYFSPVFSSFLVRFFRHSGIVVALFNPLEANSAVFFVK